MKTQDFYYDLPPELIAQTPLSQRDHSKLLVLNRVTGEMAHRHFYDIGEYLRPGDLLVMNNSKVIPARLYGSRPGKSEQIEVLLLEQESSSVWTALTKPGKKTKEGTELIFENGLLRGKVLSIEVDGIRRIEFSCEGDFYALLDKIGLMPLPHYIRETLRDNDRYQTVYADPRGSAAAPTAGLHFTNELMDSLHKKGIEIAFVTLHVGLGTFRPVKVDDVTKHKMHSEHYYLPKETADLIVKTKKNGGRVIAVGTTSCRTLEAVAQAGEIREASGYTDIFIYPGFEFRVLDGLITNFHLPESTLIMLVSAFAGKEHIFRAYEEAIARKYRFFSFGDAMLLI